MISDRYQRQTILPELGADGQRKLSSARVLCIGAGGLGSPVLLYLAAAGIGTIGIVDDDTVELSNLQRQILYSELNVGQSKAKQARDHVLKLNSTIACDTYSERLNVDNVLSLFEQYDMVIDGTDNLATKYLINDAAAKTGRPVIYGSILGFEGQVSVFYPPHGPCYRCLFPDIQGNIMNCAEAGIIGAVAGMIGSVQAIEAIKIALGLEFCATHNLEPLIGQLYQCDTRTMRSRSIKIARDPYCKVCALPPERINLQTSTKACSMTTANVALKDLEQYKDWQLVDVREQDEWDAGHMPNATLVPLSQLKSGTADLSQFSADKKYLLYCQRGRRSLVAADILATKGNYQLASLDGGYVEWKEAQR